LRVVNTGKCLAPARLGRGCFIGWYSLALLDFPPSLQDVEPSALADTGVAMDDLRPAMGFPTFTSYGMRWRM
jgi:hypothetical protein